MKFKVFFHKCTYNTSSLESDERHIVSLVYCSVEVGGRTYPAMTVEVRQPIGPLGFDEEPIEIPFTSGFINPQHYDGFIGAVRAYYKCLARFIASPGQGGEAGRPKDLEIPAQGYSTF